jgi:tRNA uridine 5-carboxymethylaminomethyl modification enzyme
LSHPGIGWDSLRHLWPELAPVPERIAAQIGIEATYAVYLKRQEADLIRIRNEESTSLDSVGSYEAMPGLSSELRQKLTLVQPKTIAQASRIEGMTPSAMAILAAKVRLARQA